MKVLAKCIAGYKSYWYVISMSDMVHIYYCVCDLGFDASNELKESSMHLQKILQKVSGSTDI